MKHYLSCLMYYMKHKSEVTGDYFSGAGWTRPELLKISFVFLKQKLTDRLSKPATSEIVRVHMNVVPRTTMNTNCETEN